jgi:hypothetical protein
MAQLPWGDASVHDSARLFYGSHSEEGQAQCLGNVLPLEVLGQLIEAHRSELESEKPRRELAAGVPTNTTDALVIGGKWQGISFASFTLYATR